MNIGLNISVTHQLGDIGALARQAEELGFESIWFPEHVTHPVHYTTRYGGTANGTVPERMRYMVDPFIGLALASASTTRLKLGTSVCLVPEHNPLELAKRVATLDHYSGGRFLFGIGAGWFREETLIMGGDFDHRWRQTREYVLAMKELWTKEAVEFHGRYIDFPPVYCYPKPVQKPHPPVLMGGNGGNVFNRVLAYGDGWMPNNPGPEAVRQGRATLDEMARSAGRDPDAIQISVFGVPLDRSLVERYHEAGAQRVLVRVEAAAGQGARAEVQEIARRLFG